MAALLWCFPGVKWLFIYLIYVHKVPRLLTGKKEHLKTEIPSVVMMTNFGFGPVGNLLVTVNAIFRSI